ncbi:conserved hypothetical protein [Segniliparus rotundus DSM 44985]|uniref:Transmembrane protein n=1 Tax=Segniliparus rotundus (strain ATCC BAA-972 / CDC 1076 / CIP 108378 / DSM 44985 / JCM 13578) TaxID=640132 RepID=D6ZC12_SEGRD|nr:gephyrin-like molybdotransferase receptor GlpR [Segniliparus rotundus]ADG96989.1 conserved hypothetical protein [Segniliparus rotundus DSM 44985]
MSVPNSILSVLLVVVWLFVLVPMVVNRRPKVMTVSQAALNTRVLFRGGLDKLKHRVRPGLAAESFEEEEDEEGGGARRPVAEVFADADDAESAESAESPQDNDDYEVADEAEFIEDDVPPRRQREDEPVDDAEVVAVRDRRHAAHDDEDAQAREEAELQQLAHRLGRGGYNPNADASARAHRYAVRQRFVLGLIVSLVAATVLAFAMSPLVWYAVAVIAATLVGYLAYLRRQVRIEEQIRARRMARFARSRGPEHAERAAPRPRAERRGSQRGETAPGESARRAARKARGPRVVAIDEDDPDFVDLPSPHDGVLRRASGQ